jgi:O-antigen/teichoic acid export membrane protein
MAWLFWILTVATPLFYIYRGVRKKDHLFIWTGLGLVAAAIFTIRYYYHLIPVEWALISGGIVMIAIAYGLIRYLKTPRHGFTSQEASSKNLLENLHLESLVIAETFGGPSTVKAPSNDFQFGGGSGGGGGAGGQF